MKAWLFIFILLSVRGSAQHENDIWYFGEHAGIRFEECGAVAIQDSKIEGFEGSATICDPQSGELLFYTNSEKVWNKWHQVMANGILGGNNSTTQVLIVRKPGNEHLYYIFYPEAQASGKGLLYCQVDLSTSGGKVTSKDILLNKGPVTEKIVAIMHSNGQDVWVIAHELGSNAFWSFLVTSSGVSTQPQVSKTGRVHKYDQSHSYADAIGEMRASPDGKRIAIASYVSPDVQVFDFDNSNGTVSDALTIREEGHFSSGAYTFPSLLYGLAFSANSRMLYLSIGRNQSSNAIICQYDLSAGTAIDINNSRFVIAYPTYTPKGMALGPDGKIYIAIENEEYLTVIGRPDNRADQCDYKERDIYLNGGISRWGISNPVEPRSLSRKMLNFYHSDTSVCLGQEVTFRASMRENELNWFYEGNFVQKGNSFTRLFTDSGSFTVKVCDECSLFCRSARVIVSPSPEIELPDSMWACYPEDVEVCPRSIQGGTTFTWPDGSTGNCHRPQSFGYVEVIAKAVCTVKRSVFLAENPKPDFTVVQVDTPCLDGITEIKVRVVPDTFPLISWDGNPHSAELSLYNDETRQVTVLSGNGCSRSVGFNPRDGCSLSVFLPNAFSPNNDGRNDTLFITGLGIFSVRMEVYDRWGELIFRSDDIKKGWDGMYRGEPVPSGVYILKVRVQAKPGRNDKQEIRNLHSVIHVLR